MSRSIDKKEFRDACALYPTGVAIITARTDDVMVGMTVNSFTSVSLDPPLILWSLRTNSRARQVFEEAGSFAVNVLSAEQDAVARHFAGATAHIFDGHDTFSAFGGHPLLDDALVHLECETRQIHDGGDHRIIIGEVMDLSARPGAPLLFFQGRLTPGLPISENMDAS